jgi:hypothetical protein
VSMASASCIHSSAAIMAISAFIRLSLRLA